MVSVFAFICNYAVITIKFIVAWPFHTSLRNIMSPSCGQTCAERVHLGLPAWFRAGRFHRDFGNKYVLYIPNLASLRAYNTPFTQGLRPFCLHCATTKLTRSPLKAERRYNDCLGRSMVVHRMFRHRHGRHGSREVLSMFKTIAQRSPRRLVAHRSFKGGRRKAHISPWWQNGCTVVGHWSPRKKYVLLWTLCINSSNASAFLVPPLCLLWPTNSVHWAITVATTLPPFGDHGNPSATLAMVLPPLCLLCATCCAITATLVVQGRHKGRAAAVTQKQNFLGLGDHWASWPFFWSLKGGTKVATLCKGGLNNHEYCMIQKLRYFSPHTSVRRPQPIRSGCMYFSCMSY